MHIPPKFVQKPSPYFLHGVFAPWCRRSCCFISLVQDSTGVPGDRVQNTGSANATYYSRRLTEVLVS